ncbi:hypothetical protein RJ40_12465 [Methanofollis aquaemaris]|uniref:Uncharacterized protein n=1 Tax=Methanofollis aquaemaris TaxID=126734 RepID=A0A8A3S7J8_9EURY|nr:hypothetical protein RJ40_12465 [Methanofollis aquaemaris]
MVFLPATPQEKSTSIPSETEALVLTAHEMYSLGPNHLEKKIEKEYGVNIPQNTIYRILLTHGRVVISMRKMIALNGQDRWLIAFMDNSSRLITCFQGSKG